MTPLFAQLSISNDSWKRTLSSPFLEGGKGDSEIWKYGANHLNDTGKGILYALCRLLSCFTAVKYESDFKNRGIDDKEDFLRNGIYVLKELMDLKPPRNAGEIYRVIININGNSHTVCFDDPPGGGRTKIFIEGFESEAVYVDKSLQEIHTGLKKLPKLEKPITDRLFMVDESSSEESQVETSCASPEKSTFETLLPNPQTTATPATPQRPLSTLSPATHQSPLRQKWPVGNRLRYLTPISPNVTYPKTSSPTSNALIKPLVPFTPWREPGSSKSPTDSHNSQKTPQATPPTPGTTSTSSTTSSISPGTPTSSRTFYGIYSGSSIKKPLSPVSTPFKARIQARDEAPQSPFASKQNHAPAKKKVDASTFGSVRPLVLPKTDNDNPEPQTPGAAPPVNSQITLPKSRIHKPMEEVIPTTHHWADLTNLNGIDCWLE